MCPRVSRISDERRTASPKSLVIEVNAARNKFPKLCPSSPPFEKRCWNRRESSASSSESATMQLRISPGGSMLSSLRKRPLEPPSSLTVTTAHSSAISGEARVLRQVLEIGVVARLKPDRCIQPNGGVKVTQ